MGGTRIDAGRIDGDAIAAIMSDQIDWRFKAMPASTFGMSVGAAVAQGLNLFRDGFFGPILVLDEQAIEHNLATMARWCASKGVALAPHGKTTMAPQLFARMLDHGAWGMTAANASQLRVYRAFGVSRIILANELLDPAALHWLAGELERDATFEFTCWVDSERGVDLMTDALRDTQRPVDVLVELGAHGGRTGARHPHTAVAVAEAINRSPVLRLAGVGGYEGALTHETSAAALSTIDSYLATLRTLVTELANRNLFDGLERVIVTCGGSAYFDQVADAITAPWPDAPQVFPVLRSGAYITHDDGHYREISPLGERPRIDDAPPFRSALRAWAQVTSRPEFDLALLTMGKRDVPYDLDLPMPQVIRKGGTTVPLTGCAITALNDQHAFLALAQHSEVGVSPRQGGGENTVEVGDWIGLGLSHPCTTFDKWQLIPMVGADGETVVDLVRTYF